MPNFRWPSLYHEISFTKAVGGSERDWCVCPVDVVVVCGYWVGQ